MCLHGPSLDSCAGCAPGATTPNGLCLSLAQNVISAIAMNTLRIPALLASFLLVACGSVVTDGGGGTGDTTTSGDPADGGSGDANPAESHPAVALTRAQNDVLWDAYWASQGTSGSTSGTSGGGEDLDPNDLFLHLSDMGVSCGSPTVDLPCGTHYEASLVLPPALQQVGVYDLENPQLVAYSIMTESGELNSPDPQDCPWGGGSIGPGTLEIISIDATEVKFKLTFTGGIWDADPSGEYTAPRCP
jgi:hypothetical protein